MTTKQLYKFSVVKLQLSQVVLLKVGTSRFVRVAVALEYVETDESVADLMTKFFYKGSFQGLKEMVVDRRKKVK